MGWVVSASPPTTSFCCSTESRIKSCSSFSSPSMLVTVTPRNSLFSSVVRFQGFRYGGAKPSQRIITLCNSSTNNGPSFGSAEDESSKNVLDAFFLGKALAETLNERIESAVGEVLSTIGRLQAEQQKQVEEFQVEVFERAKKAKEQAAREAMETGGIVPKSGAVNPSVTVSAASTNSPSTDATINAASSSLSSTPAIPEADVDPDSSEEDPVPGVSNED